MATTRWVDVLDSDDEEEEIFDNKLAIHKRKEAKAIEQRRKLAKFGQALEDEHCGEDGRKTTVQCREDVFIEVPNADADLQDNDPTKAIAVDLSDFWEKQQKRQLQRKYEVGDGAAAEANKTGGEGSEWTQAIVGGIFACSKNPSVSGKYVSPAARGGLGPMASTIPRDSTEAELNTIRVTNISMNTTESDLQELFQSFGRVSRVYLAKDKETNQSRGFAFVSFVSTRDASRAFEKLQGYGYDHLILKLEWAQASTRNPSVASGNEYRTGYGKALAQDTKSKVSYTSNLTR